VSKKEREESGATPGEHDLQGQWDAPGAISTPKHKQTDVIEPSRSFDEVIHLFSNDLIATELFEMADYIGIEIDKDPELLSIAAEALCTSLPEGWAETTTEDGQTYYYDGAGNTMWEHPNDEVMM